MVSTAEVVERLDRRLMSLGVYVERHAREATDDGETLHVEYETAAGGLASGDIGNVCTELVEAYEDGWEPVDCHFWAFTTGGAGELLGHAGRLARLVDGDVDQPALREEAAVLAAALVLELDAGVPDGVDADGVVQPVSERRRLAVVEVDVDDVDVPVRLAQRLVGVADGLQVGGERLVLEDDVVAVNRLGVKWFGNLRVSSSRNSSISVRLRGTRPVPSVEDDALGVRLLEPHRVLVDLLHTRPGAVGGNKAVPAAGRARVAGLLPERAGRLADLLVVA